MNLVKAQTAVDTGSVLAYYDDDKRDIVIRGTNLTPDTKVTLSHELTHVLQDQHFNLHKLDDEATSNDRQFATTAIEEGDAVLTEDDYAAALPKRQQQEADAEENAQGGASGGSGLNRGPTHNDDYLEISSDVPYVLGPDFMLLVYNVGGLGATNAAFEKPPTSELDIVDPATYLDGVTPRVVATPTVPAGAHRDGSADTFGAFETYMTLAGFMDARTALGAADGWGGGKEVEYSKGASTCTKINLTGRTVAESIALGDALSTWAASLPTHQASVSETGQLVTVLACDPGAAGTAGTRSREHALDVVDERNNAMAATYNYAHVSPDVAQCVGDASLSDTALAKANAVAGNGFGSPSAAVQRTIDRQMRLLIKSCSTQLAPGAAPAEGVHV